LPEASARSTAVDASRALAPEACAAALSARRPARPAASRVGSTTPGLSAVPVLSWSSRSFQVSFLRGHPTAAATGSGIATTTGLRAMEVTLVGAKPDAAPRRRSSQVDESGTQTSGELSVPPGWPTPASETPCRPATTAATSTGSLSVTSTATQMPSASAPPSTQASAAALIAGAISGAAETVSRASPEHVGSESRR
jgi:hypothetical protein